MKKESIIITLVLLLLIGATYVVYSVNSSQKKTAATAVKQFNKKSFVYFYGATCPHCKDLSEWMKKEGIEKKVKLEKLEVYYNEENSALMQEAANVCKINPTGMGVPFIYDNGKCYMGLPEAQKILKEKFDQASKK